MLTQYPFTRICCVLAAALVVSAIAAPVATAGSYSRLQVLVPGELPAPGTATGKTGTPTDQTAGAPFDIRIRACDSEWNTVTEITNTISVGSSDASATLPGGTLVLSSGELILSVTLNAGGQFTFTAGDDTDGSIADATSSSVTSWVLAGFEFNRINQKNQHVDQPMSLTVTAVDPTGDPVAGFNGQVRLRQLTSYGVGRIVPNVITLANGEWDGDVRNYRADETSINRGNVNIEAYLDASPSTNGISDPFIVHPGPFARVQVVVPGETPWPGSVDGVMGSPASQAAAQSFNVEVYATDNWWNPVGSGDTVRITSSDTGASTPVTTAMNGGFAQLTLSLATVGAQTLTVNDQSNGSIQGMTSAAIQVIAAGAHHFEVDPIPGPITAGDAVPVTIRAADAGGNTIPDFSGSAILSAVTGPGSISPESIAFVNGVWAGDMVFRGAGGSVSFSCADFSSPPHIGTSNTFEVLAGPYAGLQVLFPGQTPQGGTSSGFSGQPTDQAAGATFDLTVRAVDAYWNRVPGATPTVSFESTDAFADIPADTTLANGSLVFPIRMFRAGFQTITVADTSAVSGVDPSTSEAIEIVAGPYARILLLAPGEELGPGAEDGRTGEATDQSINFAFTVRVLATDAWWNPIYGESDLIRLTSSDALAQLPDETAMVDGEAEMVVRLSTGGFQQLTAENLSQTMPTSTTQVRAISSGFHLEAEIDPTRIGAGEPFTLTVKVTNDAGSVIQEINSTVSVRVEHASTGDDGRGSLLTTQFQLLQGQRAVQETYTFAESIVLIATDDAGNEPAVTEVLIVDPGPPASVALTSDPPWVRANRHSTLLAAVVDDYGNGVPGEPVDFLLITGLGTVTPIDDMTGTDGVARADYLGPRQPSIDRIRATSNALVAELDLETALVDPNADGGHVTNYPNPFHPGETPTTIAYKLDADATVRIRIFTLSGGLVLDETFSAGGAGGREGLNEFLWNGENGEGRTVASGTYILDVVATGAGETLHTMRRKIAAVR